MICLPPFLELARLCRFVFFFQAEDGIRDVAVTGVQTVLFRSMPHVSIVYGGVFPTYHHRDVLEQEPQIDVIVRGEGEETARRLVRALAAGESLGAIPGRSEERRVGKEC